MCKAYTHTSDFFYSLYVETFLEITIYYEMKENYKSPQLLSFLNCNE